MDKNAIKKYAVWALNELIARVSQKAQQYGITAEGYGDKNADSVNGVLLSAIEKKQRQALIAKIDIEGFEQVMEEVAYTWFNRFIALRFMEVNNYLPSHMRVFTNDANEFKPQILADAISLDIEGLDIDKVFELKDANKDEELYKYLLIVQCNSLNNILPGMFQRIEDYTELLLPDYLLRTGSVIEQMVELIPSDDWTDQVQIIGWLYQYYNDEPKNEVINVMKGTVQKKDIPVATQLFTTDWVVRYIVDNTVGRYWIEHHSNSSLGDKLKYYMPNKSGLVLSTENEIKPQELTVLDPCVGSGHFLVYAFDVLLNIYVEYGYSEREAVAEIVKSNIFGLDIDDRATQLAYFAVMMKARQYDRRFFSRQIQPQIYSFKESSCVDSATLDYFCGQDAKLKQDINAIYKLTENAKEYGSILQIPEIDWDRIEKRFSELENNISMFNTLIFGEFYALISAVRVLSKKYAVVATNPPYMNKFDDKLKSYATDNYKDYCGDLFSIFIYRNFDLCEKGGYTGFMTPFVWMFIKTYEKLRSYIIETKYIVSLIQMEYSAFEEATVPICAFVMKNGKSSEPGCYIKLSDFRGGMEVQRQKVEVALSEDNCNYLFFTEQSNFLKIASAPIAYWLDDRVFETFDLDTVSKYISPRIGLVTGDSERFLRLWFEVDNGRIKWGCKSNDEATESGFRWFPYQKGGSYRKWYGNNEYVINWENDGWECKNDNFSGKRVKSHNYNGDYAFKQAITWTKISSGSFACRFVPYGFMFDDAGPICSVSEKDVYMFLALLNSNVGAYYLSVLSPTMNFLPGHINAIPVDYVKLSNSTLCTDVSRQQVELSKRAWDFYETSWDFKVHPLIRNVSSIRTAYDMWEKENAELFAQIKKNEEMINREIIEMYNLVDVVSDTVEDKSIAIAKADIQKDIKSFISYAVGCMFGRYSLDSDGIVFAGSNWNLENYKRFSVDPDNIIPICDDEYFEDDIVFRFVNFVETVYGSSNLEDNLMFIANALGGKGSPRDVIREYFLNGFYDDHVKVYQKKPIYWLFDSGKKNGFKCLIYMHRYQPDTIARIRTDYVHEQQSRYRTALADLEQRINSASTSERVKLNKQMKTIQDQAEELRKYEEKIHHLADQMISIDLDDGVKENYAKFQDVLAKIK